MGQTPGDDKTEPSLELPSLSVPGLGRRKKSRKKRGRAGRPVEDPTPADVPPGEPAPGADEPAPSPAYVAETTTLPPAEATRPAAPIGEPLPEPADDPTPETVGWPVDEPADDPAPRRRAKKSRPPRSKPLVPGPVAAVLTGLLVGAAGSGATYGAMTGCEVLRGVSTCGGAPGFFILVAILVLMVLLGSLFLRVFKVADPGSTSFLAVGVVAVVVMLVLLDVIFSQWMFVVVPALSAAAYLLADRVTTRFDEQATVRR